jgi:hypothetical protein
MHFYCPHTNTAKAFFSSGLCRYVKALSQHGAKCAVILLISCEENIGAPQDRAGLAIWSGQYLKIKVPHQKPRLTAK